MTELRTPSIPFTPRRPVPRWRTGTAELLLLTAVGVLAVAWLSGCSGGSKWCAMFPKVCATREANHA